jgi:hypothetical protein
MLLLHNFRALILLILTTNLLPTCRAKITPYAGCYREGETCEEKSSWKAYEKQEVTRRIASCPEGDDPKQVLLECETRSKLNGPYHYY